MRLPPLHHLGPLLCLWLAGCAVAPTAPPDPLVGRVFESATATELDRATLDARLRDAEVVYLGEVHDNPDHQAIQREVLAGLRDAGLTPGLALEMAGREQTGFLMNYTLSPGSGGGHGAGANDEAATRFLRRRLDWDDEEDTRWTRYGPLLELARGATLPAAGIDLPPAQRLRLQRVGRERLSAGELRQLPPTAADDPAYAAQIRSQLAGAHCGFGTEESIARLYDTWVARNDAMALSIVELLADPAVHPVVVVVGGGHTLYGHGVPRRVAQLRPGTRQVSIGLTPVAPEPRPLADYLAATVQDGTDLGPDHELTWITPRYEREDPCAGVRELLRKRLGKAEAHSAAEDDAAQAGDETQEKQGE